MEISRKNLFKLGLFTGAARFALPAWAGKELLKPKMELPPPPGDESFAFTVCGLCPAGCGVRVRKVDGHAVGISGIPDHPVNQGGLCPKGAASLQELYHPDRLRTPLARSGPRGSGAWKEISWDEALGTLKGKKSLAALTAARAWDIQGSALRGLAGKDNVLALGFPRSEFPSDAFEKMHGSRRVAFHISRAKLLVSFGFDWLQSHPSPVAAQRAFAQLRRGSPRGRAQIVAVEPRLSVTAGKADQWVPINPGTEGLLALALAKKLIEDGAYDRAFISRAHGFAAFKKSLDGISLAGVSKATGVPEKEILLLVVKLFSVRPAAAITNRGGTLLTQLAVHALNALLGNIAEDGIFSGLAAQDGFWAEASGAQALAARQPEALLVDRVNPLFQSPADWQGVLAKIPFVATVSPFMSETAQFSDLVLPCHTPLERGHCSLHAAADGSTVLDAALKAVDPLYDTKDPGDIFLALARARGGAGLAADFDSYFKDGVKKAHAEALIDAGAENRIWKEQGGPGAARPFTNPSAAFDFDALTALVAGKDPAKAAEDADYPLRAHLYSPLAFSYGEGAHLPYLQSVAGPQMQQAWESWAELHPDSAQRFGITDGMEIWIESRKGKVRARARLSRTALPGVVSLPLGLGHTAYGRWAKDLGSNPMELGEEGAGVRLWKKA